MDNFTPDCEDIRIGMSVEERRLLALSAKMAALAGTQFMPA